MKRKIFTILMVVFVVLGLTGCGNALKKDNFKIREAETKSVKFTDFDNGLIKLKVPEGWKVDVLGDYIHYIVKAYNPEKPIYQFYFNLKVEGFNKSEDSKSWYQRFYPDSPFAKTSVIATKDTEGYFKIFNDMGKLNNTAAFTFPELNDFTVTENLGNGVIGGDILRATEGDLAPTYCLTEKGECPRKENCKTYSFWEGLDNAINDYVNSKTLEDLIK